MFINTQVQLLSCLELEKVNAQLFFYGPIPWLLSPSPFGPPFSCGLCLDDDAAALPSKAIILQMLPLKTWGLDDRVHG